MFLTSNIYSFKNCELVFKFQGLILFFPVSSPFVAFCSYFKDKVCSLKLLIIDSFEAVSVSWIFSFYLASFSVVYLGGYFMLESFLNISLSFTELIDTEFLRSSFMSISSVQFSSVAQSCPTLCDPMNCSTPGLPVHHQLLEFTQTHVHWVSDTIQPSHPLSSPSPLAPNPSQQQSLFQWVNSSHEVAKVLEFQL